MEIDSEWYFGEKSKLGVEAAPVLQTDSCFFLYLAEAEQIMDNRLV